MDKRVMGMNDLGAIAADAQIVMQSADAPITAFCFLSNYCNSDGRYVILGTTQEGLDNLADAFHQEIQQDNLPLMVLGYAVGKCIDRRSMQSTLHTDRSGYQLWVCAMPEKQDEEAGGHRSTRHRILDL